MTLVFEKDYKLSEINSIASKILEYTKEYDTIALSGSLGAGKTTLTHAIVQLLHLEDKVSSPTFSIINQYKGNNILVYHSDWYRINDEEEAIAAGIEDMLEQPGLKIIEWWEKAEKLLPEHCLYISLEVLDDNYRRIKITTNQ
ncbi:MAG TPA: tRNA (adenosine(37)-N6)-threonylcarbamoyltransferase complex ATPase subunit type 1 TsaE [Edaphocola sp.]|nr:tRNA (adenosine(37)-N6)-threonylcarbamoyltransferase complex ATPase subunit type 1 TsaE [Edaphocola sp.]